jgi:hypothetical protein
MPYLVIVVVIMIMLFRSILKKQRQQAGIKGWVKDQDLDGKGKRIYRDKQTGVTCKPDVVESNRVIEYKSAVVDTKPKWVDLLQLALQMKATGAKEAELRYDKNKKFSFNKDSGEIRAAMKKAENIVGKMRWHLLSRIAPNGTPTRNRCSACTFQRECTDAIR